MRLLVLPGDGIGPEITAATMAVLERANETRGLGILIDQDVVGFESLGRHGSTFRELGQRHGRGLAKAGAAIRDAIDRVTAEPARRMADLGGRTGTRAFGEAVAAALG